MFDLPFTAVRASATAANDDWLQSSVFGPTNQPQWAADINRVVKMSISTSLAVQDKEESGGESDADSDQEVDMPAEAGELVQPYRMRVWGAAASPGGGATAVLVSRYNLVRPGWVGKTQILFASRPMAKDGAETPLEAPVVTSAEGRVWERMYGGGPGVPHSGSLDAKLGPARPGRETELQRSFKGLARLQTCVYCHGVLKHVGFHATCPKGHFFCGYSFPRCQLAASNGFAARCTLTGLAILEPGISRVCGLCGLRCLVASQIQKMAETPGLSISNTQIEDLCTACGGKFIL